MSWGETPPGVPVLEPYDSPEHPMAPWFAHFRSKRAERSAARRATSSQAISGRRAFPRRRAIVTIVHNEGVFLPIWLGYYSRFFRPEDIYVLDNESIDGSLDGGGFVRIPVQHDRVDHVWMVETIQGLQHELVERYDVVLVTDVDEIIAPVPERGSLGDYLDHFEEEWVNCLGYELLHVKGESPLDLHRPIMSQRRQWFANGAYDKAAVATVPMIWRPGFHGRADYHYDLDPDLRLIHLHRMDYDICLERHRLRAKRSWGELDERYQWAQHNRITDELEFERWFYEDSCFEGLELKLEEIPSSWRGVF